MSTFPAYMTKPQTAHTGPCAQLAGKELTAKKGTWKVLEKIERKKNSSGGRFSVGYIAENEQGQKAFLKATDTNLLGAAGGSLEELHAATQEHIFERSILDFCQGNNMDKVVHALDYGDTPVEHNGVREWVYFIVFDLANGDSRSIIDKDKGYDFVWILLALHSLSVALRQLHTKKIAHNDVKPSNLLIFPKDQQKLADLGRATHSDMAGPFDNMPHPGDLTYAAPEQFYKCNNLNIFNGIKSSLDVRRASDLYLLGSMGYFFVTGLPLTVSILRIIRQEHMPVNWTGTYEEVLPYWRDAFGQAMITFENNLPKTPFGKIHPVWAEVATAIRQLCEPDPKLRAHPTNLREGRDIYSLERYIAQFDTLLRRYQLGNQGQ